MVYLKGGGCGEPMGNLRIGSPHWDPSK